MSGWRKRPVKEDLVWVNKGTGAGREVLNLRFQNEGNERLQKEGDAEVGRKCLSAILCAKGAEYSAYREN